MEEQNNNIQIEETGFSFEDFTILCRRFWEKRRFIIIVLGTFAVLGLAAALFQKPIYTASCVFVPQRGSKNSTSSLSSLAAIAGVNLGDMSTTENLSALLYPKLLNNVELNKELMRVPIHFSKFEEPVNLLDYYTNPDYQKFNLFAFIAKYTIGLPGTILSAIRSNKEDAGISEGEDDGTPKVTSYTKDEYTVSKILGKSISMAAEKKEGYLLLSAKMGEAQAAAELCQAALDLVGKYITNFKIEHAKATNEYILGRYEEMKKDYEEKQLALAQFTDANRGMMTATAETRREQLMADYNLAYAMYTEMSKQLLQSDMKVKEDTPVLSTVQPVAVPNQKSNSRAKTLAIWVFMGIILSFGTVFLLDWLKKKDLNWKILSRWN